MVTAQVVEYHVVAEPHVLRSQDQVTGSAMFAFM